MDSKTIRFAAVSTFWSVVVYVVLNHSPFSMRCGIEESHDHQHRVRTQLRFVYLSCVPLQCQCTLSIIIKGHSFKIRLKKNWNYILCPHRASLPLSTFSFSVCFFAFFLIRWAAMGVLICCILIFVICIWSRPSSLCWFWYYLNHEMGALHPVPYPILSVFCRWLSVPKYSYPNWRRWNDNCWYPLYILFFFLFVLHYFPYYIAYIICGEGFSLHFSCGRRAVSASCPNS